MRHELDCWRALRRDERWLLVGLGVLLPIIGVTLRLLGVRRTYRMLDGWSGSSAPNAGVGEADQATALRLGRLVGIASRRGAYAATCLGQSLALWWLLRRRGMPAEMRIGVGNDDNRFRAHAWVELAGRVISDHPEVAADYAMYRELDLGM